MQEGYTKQVQITFTFDDKGNVIDGSLEGQIDSRFVGVTFFTPEGERSQLGGASPVLLTTYDKMTSQQKTVFDSLVNDYVNIKDQK